MASGSDDLLGELNETQKIERDGVNAHIDAVRQKFRQNDSWEMFKPDEIAEASLQVAVTKTDSPLKADERTRCFRQFLVIGTNFSSLTFAGKMQEIPELVQSIKQLLENMMKEVQEYSDIANELLDLIHCFVRLVMQVKHHVNMLLPLLTAAKSQMSIVQDVMNTDPSQALNEADKKDIQLALDRMSKGIENMLSLAKRSTTDSQILDDRIHNMTNSVQSKKIVVGERLDFSNLCLRWGIPAAVLLPTTGTIGCVAAESFGGIGALVIAGTVFPPMTAIIGASVLGGIAAGTAVTLVRKFWVSRQLKALSYLNQIFESLVQLNSANLSFMRYMADAEEKTSTVSQHLDDIRLCLESERQRRLNCDVCSMSIDSTTAMIESLQHISSLDISKWTDSSNVITFFKTKTITNAIT